MPWHVQKGVTDRTLGHFALAGDSPVKFLRAHQNGLSGEIFWLLFAVLNESGISCVLEGASYVGVAQVSFVGVRLVRVGV